MRPASMLFHRVIASFALATVTLSLGACGHGGPPPMPPPGVNVAAVVQKTTHEWESFSGRVEAIESVELRPRVAGYLAGVHFHEGGEVKPGDLLFTIDDREYKAAVDSARANVTRAEARVELATSELARTESLAAAKAASTEELEQRRTEARQATADRDAARAQLKQAELNLEFTRITAPTAGRVGRAEVRPGNLVAPGTTLLSTIVSLDPVYVSFEADEHTYLRYRSLARDAHNKVRVALASETGFPHEGELVFVDNQLNPATGTIRARARVANPDRALTPGLYARIEVQGADARPLLLISDRAVQTDQDRKFVYVLGPENRVARKDVTLGSLVDGLRVVTSGLAPSDVVVVSGTKKIFGPGQPVNPQTVPMDQPEQPAAAAK